MNAKLLQRVIKTLEFKQTCDFFFLDLQPLIIAEKETKKTTFDIVATKNSFFLL